MKLHGNAKTCPNSRLLIAKRVDQNGYLGTWSRNGARSCTDTLAQTADERCPDTG